jgi:hypothetical protein
LEIGQKKRSFFVTSLFTKTEIKKTLKQQETELIKSYSSSHLYLLSCRLLLAAC